MAYREESSVTPPKPQATTAETTKGYEAHDNPHVNDAKEFAAGRAARANSDARADSKVANAHESQFASLRNQENKGSQQTRKQS